MPKRKRLAIFVHGVGSYWNNCQGWSKNLSDPLKKDGWDTKECIWNDVTEVDSTPAFNRRFNKPSFWEIRKKITYYFRKFIFDFALDATAYNKYKERLSDYLYDFYVKHEKEYEDIYIVGYSLGGWISYDFLHKYSPQIPKVRGFLTFGSSIPLNRLENFTGFHQFPWINFWGTHDVLGMPFKAPLIKDIEYQGNILLFSDTALSHFEYTRSNRFSRLFRNTINNMFNMPV